MIHRQRSRLQVLGILYLTVLLLVGLGVGYVVALRLGQLPTEGAGSTTLLVSSERTNRIFRFSGPLGAFVQSGEGGLGTPRGAALVEWRFVYQVLIRIMCSVTTG